MVPGMVSSNGYNTDTILSFILSVSISFPGQHLDLWHWLCMKQFQAIIYRLDFLLCDLINIFVFLTHEYSYWASSYPIILYYDSCWYIKLFINCEYSNKDKNFDQIKSLFRKKVVWFSGTATVQAIWCQDISIAWVRIPTREEQKICESK